ncbi:hypothetical protein KEM52_006345 [Ascosphaera acerosa]|nr:hypothetical protein KEM52_006345 [Ascosphaera acerosa]
MAQAPIIISDDEGESLLDMSNSPMPQADRFRRLDTSRPLHGKSRLQSEVDLVSSSSEDDSDIDESSIISLHARRTQSSNSQRNGGLMRDSGSRPDAAKTGARGQDMQRQGSRADDDDDDDGLGQSMMALQLSADGAAVDGPRQPTTPAPNRYPFTPQPNRQLYTPAANRQPITPAPNRQPVTPAPYRQGPLSTAHQGTAAQPGTQIRKNLYSGFNGYTSSTNPFNVPKKSQPRAEHHRADAAARMAGQPRFGEVSALQSPLAPSPVKPPGARGRPPQTPGTAIRPPAPGGEAVSIFRPANRLISTPAAPRAIFSSKPTVKKPVANIEAFKSLTGSRYEKPITYRSDEFDSSDDDGKDEEVAKIFRDSAESYDAYTYVDPQKANENLKALLEGALEDEDDKTHARAAFKRRETQQADKAVDELAQRMEGVGVKEAKGQTSGATQHGPETTAEDEKDGQGDDSHDGTVPGMNVKLLPHQVDGVAWMREKEIGKKKTRGAHPKGGILADDMGLGKTVQSIALILTNPRPPTGQGSIAADANNKAKTKKKKSNELSGEVGKGTLIVAPLALIKQWEGEIDSRVEAGHRLRTCVFHGPQRSKYVHELDRYDVVITTYGTLSAEHAAFDGNRAESGLFSNHWYRIILDEAHTIKNRNAKATKAACALAAEYRWCLTGTPMQNNLEELQSLIHFLRIKPYEDLATFKEQITKPLNNGRGGLAIRRLQVILKAFMKRRTKDVLKEGGGLHGESNKLQGGAGSERGSSAKSGGFKIVQREVITVEAEFSPEERAFYDRLQHRTDKTLERMIDSKLSYASALVLLLRLRQACNHPELVSHKISEDKASLLGTVSGKASPRHDSGADSFVDGSRAASPDDGTDLEDMTLLMGGLSVGSERCEVCMKPLGRSAAAAQRIRCSKCQEVVVSRAMAKIKTRLGKNAGSDECVPASRRARARRVIRDSDDDEEDEGTENREVDAQESHDSDSADTEGTNESDDATIVGRDSEESSTKLRKLMEILRQESPTSKTIVFSFFTSMLDKIEPFLRASGIGYARYDGGMRNDLREASLDRLRNAPSCRVLLCSLRAGSLGLNLTAASRVVILEPFWNPFVEEQAIDRVHRLNQTVDVKVFKLTIKDTVEERILDLQNKKRELANATIEGKKSAGKLTMNDMLALFGRDAEAQYRGDEDEGGLTERVKVLRQADEGSSSRSDLHARPAKGAAAARKADGSADKDRKARRAQESSVFGRRWD